MTKIMIVDDSLFMRSHFSKLLSKQGYDTTVRRPSAPTDGIPPTWY